MVPDKSEPSSPKANMTKTMTHDQIKALLDVHIQEANDSYDDQIIILVERDAKIDALETFKAHLY